MTSSNSRSLPPIVAALAVLAPAAPVGASGRSRCGQREEKRKSVTLATINDDHRGGNG